MQKREGKETTEENGLRAIRKARVRDGIRVTVLSGLYTLVNIIPGLPGPRGIWG